MDHGFTELKSIKLRNQPKFFNPGTGNFYYRIDYQLKKFYCMNFFGIDIYDENTGTILKSIKSKNSDSISFDGEGNILVLVYMAHELPWLFVYSSNGDFI